MFCECTVITRKLSNQKKLVFKSGIIAAQIHRSCNFRKPSKDGGHKPHLFSELLNFTALRPFDPKYPLCSSNLALQTTQIEIASDRSV